MESFFSLDQDECGDGVFPEEESDLSICRAFIQTNGTYCTILIHSISRPGLVFVSHPSAMCTARVEPGSSGGPLVDCWGRLIGVVVAGGSDYSGMNLAIPVDTAKRVGTQIIRDGKTATPFVGITVASGCFHEARSGMLFDAVVIEKAVPESPAAKAGLVALGENPDESIKPGDIIVGVDGKRIRKEGDFHSVLDAKEPGDIIQLTITRANDRSNRVAVPLKVA